MTDPCRNLRTRCPQISAEYIETAIRKLEDHDFVIGTGTDGGYVLFAGKREISRDLWMSIDYNREDTATQLKEKLTEGGHTPFELTPALTRITARTDLEKMKDEMPNLKSPAQEALCEFAESSLGSNQAQTATGT